MLNVLISNIKKKTSFLENLPDTPSSSDDFENDGMPPKLISDFGCYLYFEKNIRKILIPILTLSNTEFKKMQIFDEILNIFHCNSNNSSRNISQMINDFMSMMSTIDEWMTKDKKKITQLYLKIHFQKKIKLENIVLEYTQEIKNHLSIPYYKNEKMNSELLKLIKTKGVSDNIYNFLTFENICKLRSLSKEFCLFNNDNITVGHINIYNLKMNYSEILNKLIEDICKYNIRFNQYTVKLHFRFYILMNL